MFLFKFWSYLIGYVIISVEGQNLEKFINVAVSRGICLWDTSWRGGNLLTAKVRLSGFMALRHICRKLRCRMRILGKAGLPFFYARLGKRKMLVAGAAGCLLALYVLSSFVWFVEVKGYEKVSPATIRKIARREGLYQGALKWKVDPARVEKALGNQVPRIAWVSVEIIGTKARITVAEKAYPSKKRSASPAHIIAAKDGIIQEVLVLKGMAVVHEGDTVRKGQLLISGLLEPEQTGQGAGPEEEQPPAQPRYLRAEGLVRARVWYRGYGEGPLVREGLRPTGSRVAILSMKIGSREIILRGPKTHGFKNFHKDVTVKKLPRWRNITIPVEVITTRYYELAPYRKELGPEGAYQEAVRKAREQLKGQIPPGAKIIRQQVKKIGAGEENLVRVQVITETLEEIGMTREFSKS